MIGLFHAASAPAAIRPRRPGTSGRNRVFGWDEGVGDMTKFAIGDHVSWNSEAGRVSGHIVRVHVADFDYKPRTTLEQGVERFTAWYRSYYGIK